MLEFLTRLLSRARRGAASRSGPAAPGGSDAGTPARAGAIPYQRADARRVREVSEEYAWIASNPCACDGPWEVTIQRAFESPHGFIDELEVECAHCGAHRTFVFELRE
jgi:hypothetical protein